MTYGEAFYSQFKKTIVLNEYIEDFESVNDQLHTPAKLSHLIRTLRATLSGDTEPVNPAMRATLPNRDYSECCMRMLTRHFSY